MVYVIAGILGVIGLFMEGFKGMFTAAAAPFGYVAISYFESKIFYLTTVGDYFWWKLVLKPIASFIVGPIAAPIIILRDLFFMYSGSNPNAE